MMAGSTTKGGNPKKQSRSFRPSFSLATLWTTVAGGAGTFCGYVLMSLLLAPFFESGLDNQQSTSRTVLGQGFLALSFGIGAACIMAADNAQSLRGRWTRDLGWGLLLFGLLSFGGGLVGMLFLAITHLRCLPWAIIGICVGAGIGLLRRDPTQTKRGALGGGIGGFLSGLMVDGLLSVSYTDIVFAMASVIGVILTGASIGLFIRLVQDSMQEAWLLGVTTGPYEGKRYPLNNQRVTVGSSEKCDICLYRQAHLPAQLGAFVTSGGNWRWDGDSTAINGQPAKNAILNSGDTLNLGGALFRFYSREAHPQISQSTAMHPALTSQSIPQQVVSQQVAPLHTLSPQPSIHTHPAQVIMPQRSSAPSLQALYLQGTHGVFPLPGAGSSLSIGRGIDNNICLPDSAVSGHHASLENRDGHMILLDLGSTNGTTVNGLPLAPHMPISVQNGDRIHFGGCEYTVSA